MSDLTYEKLRETLRMIHENAPRPPQNNLFSSFLRPMGIPLYEAPPPPPKIQVANITFDDGTPILDPGFRAQMNAWLVDRFGYRDDPFKDHVYFVGDYGMVASSKHCAIIRNLGA